MRLVLMGNGPFAVPSFERIVAQGHEVAAVVARPPASASGKAPPESPVVLWARERQLPLVTPDSINAPETVAWLASLASELLVVCDYGQILSRDALATTRLGGINLHGSLLPRHRGAAPVQWSILAGDSVAGISVIHMTPALDAGPVLTQAATPIQPQENAAQLEARLSHLGIDPTLKAIELLSMQSELPKATQDPSLATKAPRLKKQDGELHLGYPVEWIDRQIRGLQPWPGVFANLVLTDGKPMRVIVHRASPLKGTSTSDLPVPGTLLFGKSLESSQAMHPELVGQSLVAVACDGFLAIESLQPAGKKPMNADEFLRGYARHEGMRIAVPSAVHPLLEKMMATPPMHASFESEHAMRRESL
jgi:methionyl-tRNA formyltransferase